MKLDFIERWNREYPVLKGKLKNYLDGLSIRSDGSLDEFSEKLDREVFDELDCLDCANCCKTTPALLTRRDIKRLAAFLEIPPKLFQRKYVLEDINGELSFNSVPCVFLEPDNSCSVYEVRPESCSDYPHTGSGHFRFRIPIHKKNLEVCPAVFEIIKRMKEASSAGK